MQCESLNDMVHGIQEDSREAEGKWLTFWLDKQLFGVSIAGVDQIVSMQPITEVPEYPAYAKGIINLRGSIIPLIDLRLRLDKPETAYNDHTCVIINSVADHQLGFIVDEVDAVMDISQADIVPPPQVSEDAVSHCLSGVARISGDNGAGKIILCLDLSKVLQSEEWSLHKGMA